VKTYKIPHGKHSSGIHFKPHYGLKDVEHVVTFNKSANYNLRSNDQYDINKLFGISYGYHHNNSVRFGWRSLCPNSTKIEILMYVYVDGERIKEVNEELTICTVDINVPYRYEIVTIKDKYYFIVSDMNHNVLNIKTMDFNPLKPKWGYHLYPYFGGNRTAPHNITISMN
jgi:hypothetical protein